ncbi:WapI family immunity protein [Micromonospora globispora]|uniref:WapI family immunity protein n=1 Tax=Micromonospora globispora TaxID=1450148 RepID=UPI003C6CCA2B
MGPTSSAAATGPEGFPEVVLGNLEADFVRIQALGRLHVGASDYWDGNWLITPVRIKVDGFEGTIAPSLRAEELSAFLGALRQVYHDLKGRAVLESMEGVLRLAVDVVSGGRLAIAGEAANRPGGRNRLSFVIEGLDQTYLPAVIGSLEMIERRYQTVGRP